MKRIAIDFNRPFEEVIATIRALPPGGIDLNLPDGHDQVNALLRGLYEAANGRQVETSIGRVSIAPPAAAFLKEKPFYVRTQIEFLLNVATLVIGGPSYSHPNDPAIPA
jgi:hypothetical protein